MRRVSLNTLFCFLPFMGYGTVFEAKYGEPPTGDPLNGFEHVQQGVEVGCKKPEPWIRAKMRRECQTAWISKERTMATKLRIYVPSLRLCACFWRGNGIIDLASPNFPGSLDRNGTLECRKERLRTKLGRGNGINLQGGKPEKATSNRGSHKKQLSMAGNTHEYMAGNGPHSLAA